jgi:MshEN domain
VTDSTPDVTIAPPSNNSRDVTADTTRRRAEAGVIAAHVSQILDASERPPVPAASAASKRILLGPALAKPEEFHSRLGKMLIDRDLVTRDELQRALERQAKTGERLGEALAAIGAVATVDVARVLAEQLRMPFIDLRDGVSEPDLVGLISPRVARSFSAIPVARWGDKIVIAMANPNKPGALDELRDIIGAPIMPALADPVELRKTIERLYGPGKDRIANRDAGIAFTCPGCARQLALGAEPWVMQESTRVPRQYYIWDADPAYARPVHVCSGT